MDSDGGSQIPLAIDTTTVQMLAQTVIDSLTCQGVGGVAAAGLAVLNNGKSTKSFTGIAQSGVPLDSRVLQSLPNEPINLTSEGNKFQIVIKEARVEINGLAVVPFAVLTALHSKMPINLNLA